MNNDIKKALEGLSPEKLNSLLNEAENNTGINKVEIMDAVKNKNGDKIAQMLNGIDKKKLNSLLSDKEALDKILTTPQAKALFDNLFGKK